MKDATCLFLAICVILSGCAGRSANPVKLHQFDDPSKTCDQLSAEMLYIEDEMEVLIPDSDKTGRNIACGATGIIFIVPLFFMDVKQGEKKELQAYQKRYNYLFRLYTEKGCVANENNTQEFGLGSAKEQSPDIEATITPLPDSDTINTQCPNCKATFRAKREYLGRKTQCKKCEEIFIIGE